ncbi:MAG TPA: post-COAP-1 domain-containing protein [Thermoanaerobaculia bacterium]|nr:post-COAP-1 domain-containing protein [Thermoanaerobaculia bacterium]
MSSRALPRTLTRALLVLVAALAALAAPGAASTPPSGQVTVSSTDGTTVTHTWTGTILPGANATSNCASLPEALSDVHTITIDVPAGLYATLGADFTFRITWPSADDDEILTVLDPGGAVLGSSDGGSNVEAVGGDNLPGGTYKVLACAFAAALPVSYSGELTVRTRNSDELASAPPDGLAFSASVAAENQRDESEPLVEIDRAGNIYSCGPSGSSQLAEYAQVSTDGGESFHLLGLAPRGQLAAGGGGDCALAFGLQPNALGHHDLAYSGLGPLTGFATAISPDSGHRFATAGFEFTGGVTNRGAVADRQWLTFVSENEVLLTYNQQQPRNTVVLRSTDLGLTYDIAGAVVGAASPRFPGPIRYDDAHDLVYFAWDDNPAAGNVVALSVSKDKGRTWTACKVDVMPGTTTLFASADHDSAGNIYVAYGENVTFHTYVRVLPYGGADKCNQAASQPITPSSPDPGFLPRVQVDRDAVRSTVFPWVTAGSAPGHVAVAFLGTETNGNPNLGTFKASWDLYVNVSTNMLSTDPANPPTFRQAKATTHPMHYDSICLNGLGCDISIPPGDRSMADFIAVDYNPITEKLTAVFNRTNKKPDEASGHVATTMAVTQTGGPTLGESTLTPAKPVVRTSDVDPAGDSLSSYSSVAPLLVPPAPATRNEPAADFTSVAVGPEIDLVDGGTVQDGGFTATLKVADLSNASLLNTLTATASQSLLWIFRFTNGYQDAAASARWNPIQGFTFGYNDYTVAATPCTVDSGGAGEKCLVYPGDTPIQGAVEPGTGTIRLSVPRYLLKALSGSTGDMERPAEVPATVGSRFYDATAWSLGNVVSPVQDVQSFLQPFDSTPAFDFLLAAGGGGGGTGCKVTGGGSIASGSEEGKFTLNARSPFAGNVAYRDAAEGVDFRSSALGSVTCSGSSATITGSGYNGTDATTFTVQVTDAGEPGTSDTFSIELGNGYSRSGTLTRGNLKVRE